MKHLLFISWFRAREKRLVDQIDLDRMIGAKTKEETFKVLNDTDYAPYLSGKSYLDIEKVIEEEKKDLKKTLTKMGMKENILRLLFLRDELDLICKEAKGKFFQERNIQEKKSEILKEIREKKAKRKEDVDSIVSNLYFEKAITLLKKEEKGQEFFKRYYEETKKNNAEKRDKVLLKMEEEIIEKSRNEAQGIFPILSFFIKKRRIEYFIRTIFALKKMGFASDKIQGFIKEKKTL
jgi:vacuolar-type H+-ATPase subunit C/Vma6